MDQSSRQCLVNNIIWLIRRLIQAEELYTKALDREYNVSLSQFLCLVALYENGPLAPSQIAKKIMVNSSTVTGIIDRLEGKGLVERGRVSRDRRVITIWLTEAGKGLAQKAPPPMQQKIVEQLKRLPYDEIEEIVRGLTRLTHLLNLDRLEEEVKEAQPSVPASA